MKRKSFIQFLSEAPVTDYQTFGNFSKNSSFRNRDRLMVSSPKAIENVKKKLGKTDHNLNLYFLNSPKGNAHTEVGKVDMNWLRKNLDQEVADHIEKRLDDDAINIIFTNNKGTQGVSMTPWIICHRLSHALARPDRNYRGGSQFPAFKEAGSALISGFNDILACYGREEEFERGRGHYPHDYAPKSRDKQLLLKQIGQQLCTFKSARDRNVRDYFELMNELFAQYLVTGKITFNDAPKSLKYGKGAIYLKDEEEANSAIRMLERDMSYYFDDLCNSAIGSILVM